MAAVTVRVTITTDSPGLMETSKSITARAETYGEIAANRLRIIDACSAMLGSLLDLVTMDTQASALPRATLAEPQDTSNAADEE